jgi:hypothetical protein
MISQAPDLKKIRAALKDMRRLEKHKTKACHMGALEPLFVEARKRGDQVCNKWMADIVAYKEQYAGLSALLRDAIGTTDYAVIKRKRELIVKYKAERVKWLRERLASFK